MTHSDYEFSDEFCGAGGSSQGLKKAGLRLKFAINHFQPAVDTHSANHPEAEHMCADVTTISKRLFPRTHVHWASPICTELSPGGGRRRRPKIIPGQLLIEELGHVQAAGFERTRSTFWDVIAAAEVNRYPVLVIENVAEACEWELWDVWVYAMVKLGYQVQIVSVSAAHVGDHDNPHAPQYRDRIYALFTRDDLKQLRYEPTATCWCFQCEKVVDGYQWWKPHVKEQVGKYGRNGQYLYRCPNSTCAHAIAEPMIRPAMHAIDWTDLGIRLGDRRALGLPDLAAATIARMEVGRELISKPQLMAVNHESGRHVPIDASPFSTRTNKIGDGLVIPGSFIATLRANVGPRDPRYEALAALTAGGKHHMVVTPPGAFIQKHHGGVAYKGKSHMVKPLDDPLPSLVTQVNLSLVVPYRAGSKAYRPDGDALSTVMTKGQHATATAPDVTAPLEDYHFRMIKWREAATAQRFEPDYVFTGNEGENTAMAGGAVAANVAQSLGEWAIRTLDGAAA